MFNGLLAVVVLSQVTPVDGGWQFAAPPNAMRTLRASATRDGVVTIAETSNPAGSVQVQLTVLDAGLSDAGVVYDLGQGVTATLSLEDNTVFRMDARPLSFDLPVSNMEPPAVLLSDAGTTFIITGDTVMIAPTRFTSARLANLSSIWSSSQPMVGARDPLDNVWGAVMAWDPNRQTVVRFGGATVFDIWHFAPPLDGGTRAWDPVRGWHELPIGSPSPRMRPAMTWDPVNQRFLLFGGASQMALLNDTWVLDATGWRELHPAHQPPIRWSHGLAWDETRHRAVLFGGESELLAELGDLWEWDGTDWTEIVLDGGVAPSARDAFGFAWLPSLGEVVLFGGFGPDYQSDTWSWNGSRWRMLTTSPVPPRASFPMVYDPTSGELVVTGGWLHRSTVEGTYAFNGQDWRVVGPTLPLVRSSLVVHPTLGLVAHGGATTPEFVTESATRVMRPTTWDFTGPRPLERADGGLAPLSGPAGHVVLTAFGPTEEVAIVYDDADRWSTWRRVNGTWSLADSTSTPVAPRSLAFDGTHFWALGEGEALFELTVSGWLKRISSLDAGVFELAADDGGLLLLGRQISRFTPPNLVTMVAPLPVADTRQVFRESKGRVVATSVTPGLMFLWHDGRWDRARLLLSDGALNLTTQNCSVPSWIDERAGMLIGACPSEDLVVTFPWPPPVTVEVVDAGMPDAGVPDAGMPDAGMPDAGMPDAGVPDAGVPDAGTPDAGTPDAGITEPPDAGVTQQPDAGVTPSPVPGCGCTATWPGSGLLVLVSLALRRRRSR
jgi:hypothetical protein